ncbi:hypothetical protein C8F04DRAFT_1238490 [Mycena alexandri]|uniref:Integrase core domain-containing protein n=1 Tax=Mycena alexandri TaxID=1745969 RepID=A0AAD6SH66_9AGAR|nr:hypothetical protein C8F04DRAFT_1238490 [Mycena alexandri]
MAIPLLWSGPRVVIDPNFLQFAHEHRSTGGIGRFLNVSRGVVRSALLRQGLVEPQAAPFADSPSKNTEVPEAPLGLEDDILDLDYAVPQVMPADIADAAPPPPPSTGDLSTIVDWELDSELACSMECSANLGTVSSGTASVNRSVTSIRFIVYSSASKFADGNTMSLAQTHFGTTTDSTAAHTFWCTIALLPFLSCILILSFTYTTTIWNTVPVSLSESVRTHCQRPFTRLCGDHGVENIEVAVWMEEHCGARWGSYIWGRSIHNVRIERLWVDVTAQVGATWSKNFTMLELHHGLDINNVNHIWLLHHLFLPTINDQLTFFTQSWNEHQIQIRNGPNRSPADMFYFDTLVHGAHGHALAADLSEEELEVYGVNWEGLHDDTLLQSQRENNAEETGWTSWLGRVGPPEHLNEVPVESPQGPFYPD